MGWWPFSAAQSPSSDRMSAQPNASSNTDSSPTDFWSAEPKSTSNQEQADRDLEAFLNNLERETSSTAKASNHERIESTSSPAQTAALQPQPESTPDPRLTSDGNLDISPSALYPRTMSCRAAFDQAFYCQSLGGKFNDVYRYGSIQSCSDQWGAFWFCMRVRTLSDNERRNQIAEYYRNRDEEKKKAKGSSEDVWELRTVPVEKAFWRDPDAVGVEGG